MINYKNEFKPEGREDFAWFIDLLKSEFPGAKVVLGGYDWDTCFAVAISYPETRKGRIGIRIKHPIITNAVYDDSAQSEDHAAFLGPMISGDVEFFSINDNKDNVAKYIDEIRQGFAAADSAHTAQ